TAGQQQLLEARTQEFYATLGELLDPVRRLWIAFKTAFANIGLVTVKGWEMIGASVIGIVMATSAGIDKLIGAALMKMGDWMGQAAALMPWIGDKVGEAADKIADLGVEFARKGEIGLREVSNTWQDRMLEIQGIATESEVALTETAKRGAVARAEVNEDELKAREKREKEAAKALEDLKLKAAQAGVTALAVEMAERQRP